MEWTVTGWAQPEGTEGQTWDVDTQTWVTSATGPTGPPENPKIGQTFTDPNTGTVWVYTELGWLDTYNTTPPVTGEVGWWTDYGYDSAAAAIASGKLAKAGNQPLCIVNKL